MTKEKAETNEVVEATANTLSKPVSFGAFGNMGREDFKVPRICLVQNTGELGELFGNCKGKYIDNIEGTIFGDEDDPMEVMILGLTKAWQISEMEGDKNYIRTVPFCDENAHWEWQGEDKNKDGVTVAVSRSLTWSYYVIPVKSLLDVPAVFALKKSGRDTAKTLNTLLRREDSRGVAPYARTYLFSVNTVKAKKGVFYVPTVKVGRPTTKEEQAIAEHWYSVFQRGALKAEEDVSDDEAPRTVQQPEVNGAWF